MKPKRINKLLGTLSFGKHWAYPRTEVVDPHRTKNGQNAPSWSAGNKKKVDSSSTKSRSFFFVGKLDATSSCVEYNPSNGGEGQNGRSHSKVLMTPKKV